MGRGTSIARGRYSGEVWVAVWSRWRWRRVRSSSKAERDDAACNRQLRASYLPSRCSSSQRTPVSRYRLSGYARVGQVCGTSQAPRGWQADLGSSTSSNKREAALTTSQPNPTHCLFSDFNDDNLNEHAGSGSDSILASSRTAYIPHKLPTACPFDHSSPASRPRLGPQTKL